MLQHTQLFSTLCRRTLRPSSLRTGRRQLSTTPATKDESWTLTTKLGILVAAIVAPTGIMVVNLRSDPELRDTIRIEYPTCYDTLHTVIPGGIEGVTKAELLAKKNDWPLEYELPWGEGYDEDIPPRKAIVTTKRGAKFTVELVSTDINSTIIPKIIPFGASFDDQVLDVQFSNDGQNSMMTTAMTEQREARAPVEGMTKAELKQRLVSVREAERQMKVDRQVWANMGANGIGKVTELDRELYNIDKEKSELKRWIRN